jgi:uncharacterized protein (TIGR03083 family)
LAVSPTDDEMTDPREDFGRAAEAFCRVVEQIEGDQWGLPGLGEWTVRELVGHALRAVQTAAGYLDEPADVATLSSAGEYFRAALVIPELNAAVAERGRESGRELGADPVARVRSEVDAAVARVSAAELDEILAVIVGSITLRDYLPTRIFELVAHTDDICRAVGVGNPMPTDLVLIALCTALGLYADDERLELLRQLTGRGAATSPLN